MSRARAALLIAGLLALAAALPSPSSRATQAAVPLRQLTWSRPASSVSRTTAPRSPGISFGPPPPIAPRLVLGATTSQLVVALTFDLDMTPDMAAQWRNGAVPAWINLDALGVLRATGTPATLFMTGMWAELYPGLARSLAQDPHFEIANHSYSHPAFHRPCYLLGGLGPGGASWQLGHAQAVLSRITGVTPTYFRFPGGCYDSPAIDAVHAAGLVPVEWTVNGMDAFNPNAVGVAAAVLAGVKPGGIVLMHLQGGVNAPATGTALRMIIPALRQRGYRIVTVGQLLSLGVPLQPATGREVVEAFQPAPALPNRPSAATWAVTTARIAPARPCWRWDARARAWVRC